MMFQSYHQWERDNIPTTQSHVELKVFLTFQLLGGIGNAAMLLTALVSKRVVRHCTWINFCLTWVIYSLSYALLLFSGQQTSSAGPSYSLCVIQAALIYGAPILTAFSSLALVIQVWLSLRYMLSKDILKRSSFLTILLVLVPYIAWFAVFLGALASGVLHPDTVGRAGSEVYCVITTGIPGHVSIAIVAITLLLAIFCQAAIVRTLYKDWRVKKEVRYSGQVSLLMIARIGSFILISFVAISQTFIFILLEIGGRG